MKCACGFQSGETWILCRVIEKASGRYQVEICESDGSKIACSSGNLGLEKTLDFIVEVAQKNSVLPHLHLERDNDLAETQATPTTAIPIAFGCNVTAQLPIRMETNASHRL